MKRLFITGLFLLGLGWALFSVPGLAAQGTYDSLILDFKEDIGINQIQAQINAIEQKYHVRPKLNSLFSEPDHIFVVKGDRQLLDALRSSELRSYTEYIEPNYTYKIPEASPLKGTEDTSETPAQNPSPKQAPNDPLYSKQWNLHSIGVESAWTETRGKGVTVAVIDTGISEVPDLRHTKFAPGYDFVNDQEMVNDDNGHGTHIAGTIAQSTNNAYGVAGIAYEATLMPLKVLSDGGGGTVSDIAEAIRFAADRGASVINLSLGGAGESQLMQEAIDYAHNRNVVIVAAVGNSNTNAADYPARYPHVLSVAALDAAGEKAPYSNFGAGVDLSAPGGSTVPGTGAGGILQNTLNPQTGEVLFTAFQGTSMAVPHVAGVAALVKAAGVQEADRVRAVLQQSARSVPEDALNYFGAGKLDAGAAVKLALHGQITFNDFFRWLRDNGYLNLRFWIDGGAVALLPKLAMVIGSYLLAWFLRVYFPFSWGWPMATGLVVGSSGLFWFKGVYLFDLPQAPFRILGSSLPELGSAVAGSGALNPITASVTLPLLLLVLLLGHQHLRGFAIGATIGVAACLATSAVIDPSLIWLGEGPIARGFLMVNAGLCYFLARLALKPKDQLG